MTPKINLESVVLMDYTVDELTAFSKRMDAELKKRRNRSKIRQKIIRMAKEAGLNITIPPDKDAETPKYRNPQKSHDTWTGKGKYPAWLAAELKAGKKLEDFEVRPETPAQTPAPPPAAPVEKKSWMGT